MAYRYDQQSRIDDLLALFGAKSADELHRALVLGVPAATDTEHSMPLAHFERVHERAPDGAVVTAMLLVTDQRWAHVSQRLIDAIAETGLVPDDELDLLAQGFVAANARVYWACPDDWFDAAGIVIDFESAPVATAEPQEDDPPTVVARTVPAGVRRWAAERLARCDPTDWSRLLRRADELGGADGGALVRGILDAIDVLDAPVAGLVRNRAVRWGRADVRLAGLELLAAEDLDLAKALAARDPNEKVRRAASRWVWAPEPQELQPALF